jgi:hypothetical protein
MGGRKGRSEHCALMQSGQAIGEPKAAHFLIENFIVSFLVM